MRRRGVKPPQKKGAKRSRLGRRTVPSSSSLYLRARRFAPSCLRLARSARKGWGLTSTRPALGPTLESIMSMVPRRLLVTVALGAALASTNIAETRAMPIPVTTADAIASPALTEQTQWRGYGWRGYGWRGYGWRGYGWRGYGWRGGWGWGGGAMAAGLIAGGLIGAAAAAPYYGYGYPAYDGYPAYYGYPYAYRPRHYGYRRAFYRPYRGYRRAYYARPYYGWGYRRPHYARPYGWGYRRAYW